MIEIIIALLLIPAISLLIGWLWWRWGSRWWGYHPRTREAYEACLLETRAANENRRQRGLWLVTK